MNLRGGAAELLRGQILILPLLILRPNMVLFRMGKTLKCFKSKHFCFLGGSGGNWSKLRSQRSLKFKVIKQKIEGPRKFRLPSQVTSYWFYIKKTHIIKKKKYKLFARIFAVMPNSTTASRKLNRIIRSSRKLIFIA